MGKNKTSFIKNVKIFFGCLFMLLPFFIPSNLNVYAEPVNEPTAIQENTAPEAVNSELSESTDGNSQAEDDSEKDTENQTCQKSLGSLGWIVCPGTGVLSQAIDWIYDKIEEILIVNPISMEDNSPVYEIWKYCRGVTNIVFCIFLLIVVYSQLTGFGIGNYGIKKALPKLIIAAILVNLSFIICSVCVDLSNIIGSSIRGLFTSVEEATIASGAVDVTNISFSGVFAAIAGGTTLGVFVFDPGIIWLLIPVVLGAIVAVVSGLITVALRQAVIVLLIMISPLAFVALILPNTESLFKKWKNLLYKMLIFYPAFGLLFGASNLAGWAIIISAKDGFAVLLGLAVQVFPLFFAWKLMSMSGTFLSGINGALRGIANKPLANNRAWANSHASRSRANYIANSKMPSAHLKRFLDKRKTLREEDTKNATQIIASRSMEYAQYKIAGVQIDDEPSKSRTSQYTRNAKAARSHNLLAQNATSHAEHVLNNYGNYHKRTNYDRKLNDISARAFLDYGRAAYVKDIDEENDISFLVNQYLSANKRDVNGKPVDEVAFNRYIESVAGPDGEQRVVAKIIAQAAKVESKQRAEFSILHAKYGHNGYNKQAFRSWINGYLVNDDGWAIDKNGNRLKDENGKNLEVVRGDILTRAPEKIVLYNQRDEQGLYYDMRDQDGKIVARIHRGKGTDGLNHDDGAFIKETLSNYDIPIGDPVNDIYSILSGVKPGDIKTPQGENEIGLARYSTTIARAMNSYKSNAAWAGAMFNTGIGNRQIGNSAQYAIWTLDSIKKTLKPGAFNTQNPASVEYLLTLMNPDNWSKIFTENEIASAVNINNESFGGEDWEKNEDGTPVLDENGNVKYHSVDNPNYEQRMNTIKRKLLIPAMKKILPAFDRLRTSNTADNQKPGTADMMYEFLMMEKEKWENNNAIPFDPTLVDQDLPSEAMNLRMRKHDKNGNLIYDKRRGRNPINSPQQDARIFTQAMEEAYARSGTAEDLMNEIFGLLNSKEEYARALEYFDEQCNLYPNATMSEIQSWFDDISALVL